MKALQRSGGWTSEMHELARSSVACECLLPATGVMRNYMV